MEDERKTKIEKRDPKVGQRGCTKVVAEICVSSMLKKGNLYWEDPKHK